MEKENNSKANKAKSTSASNSTNSKAKNAKAKNERTDSKISDNAIKDTNKANKSNLKASQTENDIKPEEKRDDLTLASQEEKIKKNAGKDSKRKKAAVATAVVLLLIAGVTVPTAVYLSRRKVSVDISNNVDVIQEYTINIKRGATIKDIVPQEIKGYTFVGFYKDAALTNPYKDTDKINKDTTIYAKYEANIYKVTLPTSPSFTIEGEGIVDNQVEVEYNSEYSFKLELNPGYEESDVIVKVNGEALTPDQEGYYTITINGDMTIEVEGVEINTYEVTFYDSLEKNEIYQNQEIQYNQLCTYTGVTPTKTNTHTYKYTFIGWVNAQGEIVDLTTTRIVSDLELFADFKAEYIEYSIHKPEQVNIQNEEGIYLSNTATLHYGDIVTITYDTTQGYDVTAFEVNGAEKISGSENQYRITGNLEVIYTEEIQTFTVSIAVNNADYGTVSESSITVDYGTAISVNGNQLTIGDTTITAIPTTDNPTYDYAFTGWTNTASEVTEAITIIANFEMTMDEYEVTIAVNDASYGTINLSTVTVNYDTPITVEDNKLTINGQEIIATPTASDAQYTYAFGNWTIDDIEVTSASKIQTDLTITANFTRTVNAYTVRWLNWDGSTLETDLEVKYGTIPEYNGETPTREETASHSYTFTGWDQEISPVTGDITYTAVFDSEIKASYDFTIEDGIITSYTGNDTYVVLPSTYSLADMVETRSATLTYEEFSSFDGSDFANTPMAIRLMYLGGFYCTINGGERTFYNNFREFDLAYPNGLTDETLFPIQIDGATYEIALNGTDDGQEAIGYAFESIRYATMMAEGLGKPFNITFDDGTALENQTSAEQAMTQVSMIMEQKMQELTAQNPDITEEELMDQIYRFKFTTTPYRTGTVVAGDDFEVTGIADGVFANSDIETIRISENITSIGTGILSGCSNLKEIIFSATNCETTLNSFIGLSNSVTITVTSNVKRIPSYFLISLEEVTQPGTTATTTQPVPVPVSELIFEENSELETIGEGAFGFCSLNSLTLPSSIKEVENYAFEGSTIKEIYFLGDVNDWVGIKFVSAESNPLATGAGLYIDGTLLENAEIDKAEIINTYVFSGYTTLQSITIGAQVKEIHAYFVVGCTNLASIEFEDKNDWINTDSLPVTGNYNVVPPEYLVMPEMVESLLQFIKEDGNIYWLKIKDILPYTIVNGEITDYIGAESNVVIPKTYSLNQGIVVAGTDYAITGIRAGAFSNNEYIESITIPNTITNITPGFVSNCINLQSLIVEDGNPVYHSDGNAIIETESKTLILGCKGTIIPSNGSVTSIGNHAFYRCAGLTSITIPQSVTSIGMGAFEGCTQLSSVTFENTENWFFVESIDSKYGIRVSAEDLSNSGVIVEYLTSTYSSYYLVNRDLVAMLPFTIVDGVVTGYTGRANAIDIPSTYSVAQDGTIIVGSDHTVTGIGANAFSGETTVTSITIPASVTSIGVGAFKGCTQLSSVTFENTENWFFVESIDSEYGIRVSAEDLSNSGVIVEYLTSTYSSYYLVNRDLVAMLPFTIVDGVVTGYTGSGGAVVIPSTYSIAQDGTFISGTDYTITSIGTRAFSGETTITSVTIGDSVTSIGNSAFEYCSSLTEINFNATNMSDLSGYNYVFYNAGRGGEGITVNIGANVTRIPAYLFNSSNLTSYSPKITTVNFAENSQCTSIGSYAFQNCTSLTDVYYTGDINDWVSISFADASANPLYYGANLYVNGNELVTEANIDTATSIGNFAFYGCNSITSVTIGNQVTSIESSAFQDCSSLENIIVDEGNAVYHSDGNCLIETESKTLIVGCKTSIIPSDGSVTSIGERAFYNCTSLTSITIPESVTSIGEWAFSGCSSLTEINFNATNMSDLSYVNYVFYNAGQDGEGITVNIGANVTRIPARLFYPYNYRSYSPKITTVNFAENSQCTSIGNGAFGYCTSLTEINFNATNMSDLSRYNDVFYNAGRGGEGITVNIGANVTRIPAYLFYPSNSTSNSPKITTVNFAENSQCTSIGYSAFYSCNNLTDVYYLGDINGWVSISFGNNSANPLNNGANLYVNGNELVTEANIDTATSIGAYAFCSYDKLTSVTIGNQVTSIGSWAFLSCSSLTDVYYTGDINEWVSISFDDYYANPLYNGANLYINGNELVTEANIDTATVINAYAFYGCTSITSVTIGDQVTSIGEWAFYNCTSLTSVTIGDSVTSIGEWAFYNCGSLTSIVIPDSVTSIGDYAFDECSGLTSITIGEGVTSIGNYAFLRCSSLENIIVDEGNTVYHSDGNCLIETGSKTLITGCKTSIIPSDGSVTSIGSWAFSGCSSLTSITIPDSVTSIGNQAFYRCAGLTSITIPDSVTSIGGYAFSECSSLTSVTIGDGVTSIGGSAFSECSSLTSITIPDSVTSIGNQAFYRCAGLTSITIPDSVTSIGGYAFSECSSLTSVTIGDGVTSIGGSAFSSCTSLTSITIPDSVTSIGGSAFDGCSSLTSVTIESNYAYANAGTGYNQCGYLLQNATEVRVLTSCIGDSTNSYLENASNFTKTTSADGLYYIYTKV